MNPGAADRELKYPYVTASGERGFVVFPPVGGTREHIDDGTHPFREEDDLFSTGRRRSGPSGLERFFSELFAPPAPGTPRSSTSGVNLRAGNQPIDAYRPGPTRANAARLGDEVAMVNAGAIRNDPLDPRLQGYLQQMSRDLGVRIEVYSGGQEAAGEGGRRTGSTRHDHGFAADCRIYRNGQLLSGDQLGEVVDYWLDRGWGGVGFGMDNGARDAGIHLDMHANRARFWAYEGTRLPPNVRQVVARHVPNAPALQYA